MGKKKGNRSRLVPIEKRPDSAKRPPFIEAASKGDIEAMKEALKKDPYLINIRDHLLWTPLMEASYAGQAEAVDLILQKQEQLRMNKEYVNFVDRRGWTALTKAAFQGHAKVCKLLLDAGANVDHLNVVGYTPLMHACGQQRGERSLEVVKVLLSYNANVHIRGKDSWTAILRASNRGNAEIVGQLLKHGAKIDDRNQEGQSALIRAAIRGHIDVVKKLFGNVSKPIWKVKKLEAANDLPAAAAAAAEYEANAMAAAIAALTAAPAAAPGAAAPAVPPPPPPPPPPALAEAAAAAAQAHVQARLAGGPHDYGVKTARLDSHGRPLQFAYVHYKDTDGKNAFQYALECNHKGIAVLVQARTAVTNSEWKRRSWLPLLRARYGKFIAQPAEERLAKPWTMCPHPVPRPPPPPTPAPEPEPELEDLGLLDVVGGGGGNGEDPYCKDMAQQIAELKRKHEKDAADLAEIDAEIERETMQLLNSGGGGGGAAASGGGGGGGGGDDDDDDDVYEVPALYRGKGGKGKIQAMIAMKRKRTAPESESDEDEDEDGDHGAAGGGGSSSGGGGSSAAAAASAKRQKMLVTPVPAGRVPYPTSTSTSSYTSTAASGVPHVAQSLSAFRASGGGGSSSGGSSAAAAAAGGGGGASATGSVPSYIPIDNVLADGDDLLVSDDLDAIDIDMVDFLL